MTGAPLIYVGLFALVLIGLGVALIQRQPRHDPSRHISDPFHNEQHKRAMEAPLVKGDS